MPNPEDTYRAALVRAAELLGGAAVLAGDDKPSTGTFLKVIDILLEDNRGLEFGRAKRGS